MEIMRTMKLLIAGLMLTAFAVVMSGCGVGADGTGTTATIVKYYTIAGTSNYSGISVLVTGTASYSPVTTGSDGKFTLNVGVGTYTVQASKSGYFTIKDTVSVTALQTYDLGSEVMVSSNAPGAPF